MKKSAPISLWSVIILLTGVLIIIVVALFFPQSHEGSPRAGCVMNQRNLQQAVRSYQATNNLKPGDPLDWNKIIGPGLLIEKPPICPVHGAYSYPKVIPAIGVLVSPCIDPAHKPPGDTSDW